MKALRRYDHKKENYKLLEQIYIHFDRFSMPFHAPMHLYALHLVQFCSVFRATSYDHVDKLIESLSLECFFSCSNSLHSTIICNVFGAIWKFCKRERESEKEEKNIIMIWLNRQCSGIQFYFFFAVSILLEGSIPFYAWAERNLHLTQTRIHRTNGRPNDNSPTIRKHSKRPTCLSANMREKWSVYMAFFWCVCMYVCVRSVLPFEMK